MNDIDLNSLSDEDLQLVVDTDGAYIPGYREPNIDLNQLSTPDLEAIASEDTERTNRIFRFHGIMESKYDALIEDPETAQKKLLDDPELYQWAARHRPQEKQGFIKSFASGLADMAHGFWNLGVEMEANAMTAVAAPFSESLEVKDAVQKSADLTANAVGNLLFENNRLVAGTFGKGGLLDKASTWIANEFTHDEEGRELIRTAQIERNRLFQRETLEMQELSQQFHTTLGEIIDEVAGTDFFGNTTPDPKAAEALGEVLSPDNWLAFGTGSIYRRTTRELTDAAAESAELATRIRILEQAGGRATKETSELIPELVAKKSQVDKVILDRKEQIKSLQAKLEAPSPARKFVGEATEGAGRSIRRAGEKALDVTGRASEKFSGIFGEEAADLSKKAATVVSPGKATGWKLLRGGAVQSVGRDIETLGKLFQKGAMTTPFWRAYKALDKVGRPGRLFATGADMMDLANFSRYTVAAGRGTVLGGAIGYATGLLSSSGDTDAAAASAGGSGLFGMTGGVFGSFRDVRSRAQFDKEVAGTHRAYLDQLSPMQREEFSKIPVEGQKILAYYGHVMPDVSIRTEADPTATASAWFDSDRQEIVLNTDAKHFDSTEVIRANAVHEIAHSLAAFGLSADADAFLLGDAALKEPGVYTKRDENGDPVLSRDGESYEVDDEFLTLKADYENRLGAKRTNEQISQEVFAESIAGYFLDRGGLTFAQDLKSGPVDDAIRRIQGWARDSVFTGPKVLQKVMGSMGTVFRPDKKIEWGTGIFSGKLRNHPELKSMARKYLREVSRTAKPAEYDKDGSIRTFSRNDLRNNPNLAEMFSAGDEVVFADDGKVQFNPITGEPMVLTRSEMRTRADERARVLNEEIQKNDGTDDLNLVRTRSDGLRAGRYFNDEVLDMLEKQGVLNPIQLKNIRILNDLFKSGDEAVDIGSFYQAVTSKLTGGRSSKRKSLSGRHRIDLAYGFKVSDAGNVLVQTIALDTLADNAQRFVKAGHAKAWGHNLKALLDDVDIYLKNLTSGRTGETGLGPTKRDAIQNLLGIRTQQGLTNPNPWHTVVKAPRTIHTSLRLDRMNKMRVRGQSYNWDHVANERAKLNYRPETGPDGQPSSENHLDETTMEVTPEGMSELPVHSVADAAAKLPRSDLDGEEASLQVVFPQAQQLVDDFIQNNRQDLGGQEHAVYIDADTARVYRINHPGQWGRFFFKTPGEYLDGLRRLDELNEGRLDLQVHGWVKDPTGRVSLVHSTRFIEGKHPMWEESLYGQIEDKGWKLVDDNPGEHYEKGNLSLYDVHPGNVIVDTEGDYVIIDATIVEDENSEKGIQ